MKYILQGLNCVHCAGKIEQQIRQIPELEDVKINLATMSLRLEPAYKELVQQIVDGVEPGVTLVAAEKGPLKLEKSDIQNVKNNLLRILLSGILLAAAMLSSQYTDIHSYINYGFSLWLI